MSSAFVTPDTTRLELSEGRWVEIRSQLSYGETMQLGSASFLNTPGPDGTPLRVFDQATYKMACLRAFLVDWNFQDDSGRQVPYTAAALTNLNTVVAKEVSDALDAHMLAQETAKKAAQTPSTTTGSTRKSSSAAS